jgi:hypothetical protein
MASKSERPVETELKLLKLRQMGTQKVQMNWVLPWLVRWAIRAEKIFVLPWLV